MATFFRTGVLAIVTVMFAALSSPASAQDAARITSDDGRDESLYHRQPTPRPDSRSLIHQKAEAYAAQRRARLASLNWYGMSNARPTASPTPFASRYSPVWEMPGHRPYAWHPVHRPGHVFYTR